MGRKLGQHFLRNPAVLDDIVAACEVAPGDPVLEIGPGEGVLTERLLQRETRVTAVELDPSLAETLRRRWEGHPGFRLIVGDARKLDLSPRFLFGESGAYTVAANLPYYLTTPLLFRFAAQRRYFTRLVLMVQKEVAARIVSGPEHGKDYGSLGIALQHGFTARLVRKVPPGSFHPPPKVHSAVISLTPKPPRLDADLELRFYQHVKELFTRRRKRMAGGLQQAEEWLGKEAWAAIAGRLGDRRAEELSPEEHLDVFLALQPGPGREPPSPR